MQGVTELKEVSVQCITKKNLNKDSDTYNAVLELI